MQTLVVRVDNPDGLNLIFGQSHFIKTIDDLHEALVGTICIFDFLYAVVLLSR